MVRQHFKLVLQAEWRDNNLTIVIALKSLFHLVSSTRSFSMTGSFLLQPSSRADSISYFLMQSFFFLSLRNKPSIHLSLFSLFYMFDRSCLLLFLLLFIIVKEAKLDGWVYFSWKKMAVIFVPNHILVLSF